MLNFYRINSVSDPLFADLFNLYRLSFSRAERRSWAGLEYELTYEKQFFANALVQNDKFAGLFNYWTFENFYYIEHFAIIPAMRGQHIGTEAMEMFKSQTGLPVIMEVEMPEDPASIRRIEFYKKLGFSVLSNHYAQPPYEGDGFLLPMLLMSNDLHFGATHFERIKKTIYDKVYHYEIEGEKEEFDSSVLS